MPARAEPATATTAAAPVPVPPEGNMPPWHRLQIREVAPKLPRQVEAITQGKGSRRGAGGGDPCSGLGPWLLSSRTGTAQRVSCLCCPCLRLQMTEISLPASSSLVVSSSRHILAWLNPGSHSCASALLLTHPKRSHHLGTGLLPCKASGHARAACSPAQMRHGDTPEGLKQP